MAEGASIFSSSAQTTKIGEVTYHSYGGTGKVGDYSIVTVTNSNFATTNMLFNSGGGVAYVNGSASAPAGTTIAKYGRTTGYSSGKVTSTNHTQYTPSGLPVRGLTLSSVRNSSHTTSVGAGDSGGCVFIMGSGNSCKITGTVSGKPVNAVPNNEGYMAMYHSPTLYAIDNQGFKIKTN